MDLGEPLFIAMHQDFWKKGQVLVELGQGLAVIPREQNLFPHVLGTVRSFDCLDEKMDLSFFFSNSRVQTIGQGAGGSVA